MAVQENTNLTTDFAKAQSIDFVNRFTGGIKKLQEMKAARDNVLVRQRLDALRTAAEGSDNLMPYILDCARVYCTEGEICGELRKVFGEYRPMEVL